MFDSEFNPLNWIIHYKEYAVNPSNITRIMGYGGEFFTGFYFDVHKRLSLKLIGFKKEISTRVMERIDDRMVTMMELSETDARDLFYQRERDLFWVSSNIRALLPYRKVYTPFRDPRMLALGYRYKGGIRACPLHETLLSTFPVNVQNIMINKSKLLNIYDKIKLRLWPFLDQTLFADADHFINTLDFQLFNNIINEKKIKRMIRFYSKHIGGYAQTLHKMLGIQYFFNNLSQTKRRFNVS